MSDNVQLPALGESVTEGTVTRWLKNVGDTVEVDEPLLEISTDKVDTEIPSPFAGVLEQILVQEDETVEVGATLAVIGSGEGSSSQDAAPAEEPAAEARRRRRHRPRRLPPRSPPPRPLPRSSRSRSTRSPPPRRAAAEQGGGTGENVTLPALGESVTEGTVTRWLKAVGDEVAVDEPLLEISTDKVDTEIPSPIAGTLQQILVQEDETVEVGAVLAVIGSGSAPAAAPQQSAPGRGEGAGAGPEPEAPEPQTAPEPAAEQESARGRPRAGPGDADAGARSPPRPRRPQPPRRRRRCRAPT